jgi:chromosome segregation ATPase
MHDKLLTFEEGKKITFSNRTINLDIDSKIKELENDVATLTQEKNQVKEKNKKLQDRVGKLEEQVKDLQESLTGHKRKREEHSSQLEQEKRKSDEQICLMALTELSTPKQFKGTALPDTFLLNIDSVDRVNFSDDKDAPLQSFRR